jgi:predicted DNA repair protein MutK
MSAGLAALLDDIAALAKLAAASIDDVGAAAGRASVKAAGVVVDDTAVTPRYVTGVDPKRELPIIWRITKGSLVNKILIILPLALILSQFAPWLLTPILMIGGTYLCFEGAEKVYELFTGGHEDTEPASEGGKDAEDKVVKGAVRTDFILSAEIMVISLNEVAHEPLLNRAIILFIVAIAITLLVYGVVGLIVKMDDIGLHMARRENAGSQKIGRGLVKGMPHVLSVISTVGIFAMLWVGGHIMLTGLNTLGVHAPYELVHHLAEGAHHVAGVGAFLAWLVETLCSLVLGALWGAVVLLVIHLLPFGKKTDAAAAAH